MITAMSDEKATASRTRRTRARVAGVICATVFAGGTVAAVATPAFAAGSDTTVIAAPICSSTTASVNPLNGTAGCAGEPTAVEQRYEAILAGAGIVSFGGAALVYQRRHRRGGDRRGRGTQAHA